MDGGVVDRSSGLTGEAEGTPFLDLEGFVGPLVHLLTRARAQAIDLTRLSLAGLVDQLAAALQHAPPATQLGQKADWVVMTAWLVQLRSRLLLPADAPAQQAAEVQAIELRDRLVELQAMQALAHWLERRPQHGRDVFGRGQGEDLAVAIGAAPAVDVVGFLWAGLALFDEDADAGETANAYRPRRTVLYSIAEASARILLLLAEAPEGGRFERFLPDVPDEAVAGARTRSRELRRSAWGSTFIARLELAKQGSLTLAQDGPFRPITVTRNPAAAAAQASWP